MKIAAVAILILLAAAANAWSGQQIHFARTLNGSERDCLTDLLRRGHWRLTPQFHREMLSVAVVARVRLGKGGREEFIYIMDEPSFCGTAGCSMLIGQLGKDGTCRELYDGDGLPYATDVLSRRDHGYRRLYTPCELRFDGREYRQIHDECPNIDVQR